MLSILYLITESAINDLVKSFTDKNFYVATSLFLYCMGLYLKVYNAEQKKYRWYPLRSGAEVV